MTAPARLHRALDRVAGLPGLRYYFMRRYEAQFTANRDANLFRGVFDTFEAAEQSAPATRPLGYDNANAAAMYLDRTRQIYSTDFPVMFWLQRLFADGSRSVFDLGGHVGVSYYAYQRHLTFPEGLRWTVHDVPAVMEAGVRLATERDNLHRLSFATEFDALQGFDILFALGSPQYLPEMLADRLARLSKRPRHLLLNLIPLHEKHSFFTLQSIGTAFCPYRITSVADWMKGFGALGYTAVGHWENPEKKCAIPFHAEHSLDRYHGFYFRQG